MSPQERDPSKKSLTLQEFLQEAQKHTDSSIKKAEQNVQEAQRLVGVNFASLNLNAYEKTLLRHKKSLAIQKHIKRLLDLLPTRFDLASLDKKLSNTGSSPVSFCATLALRHENYHQELGDQIEFAASRLNGCLISDEPAETDNLSP
ncbi:MAG: hypothetical protein V1664_03665 [Candidatus Uhrbacteria bacterium]